MKVCFFFIDKDLPGASQKVCVCVCVSLSLGVCVCVCVCVCFFLRGTQDVKVVPRTRYYHSPTTVYCGPSPLKRQACDTYVSSSFAQAVL